MTLNNIIILIINAIAHSVGFSVILYSLCICIMGRKINALSLCGILLVSAFAVSLVAEAYILVAIFIAAVIFMISQKISGHRMICSVLISMALCFINLWIVNFIYFALGLPAERVSEIRTSILYNFTMSAIYTCLAFIYAVVIKIIGKKVCVSVSEEQENVWGGFLYVIVVGVLFLLGVTAAVSMFTIVVGTDNIREYLISCNISVLMQAVISVMVLIFVLFALITMWASYKFMQQKTREAEIEKDKEIAQLYKQEIQNMYDEISDFKHDYMKIYSSMSMMIEKGMSEELKTYFSEQITPLQDQILAEQSSSHNLMLAKDSIIQGLIYTYALKARKNNIKFYVAIDEEIPVNKNISSIDLSRILGILLDNAFEEVAGCKNGWIRFAIYLKDGIAAYTVENVCSGNTENIKKIIADGYSTKGEDRGRGLSIIRKICERNKNVLFNIDYSDKRFTAEIRISITPLTSRASLLHSSNWGSKD